MSTPRKPSTARSARPALKAQAPLQAAAAETVVTAPAVADAAPVLPAEAVPAAVLASQSAPHGEALAAETSVAPKAPAHPQISGDFPMTATKTLETSFAAAKEQFDKFTATFFTSYEDFTAFSKDNVEAVVKAQTALVKGTEELSKTLVALSQANFEAAVSTTKALFTATTINQVVDLQNEAAKTSIEKMVSEGGKVSELVQKVANEVVEPIKARVDVAVQKALKPAA